MHFDIRKHVVALFGCLVFGTGAVFADEDEPPRLDCKPDVQNPASRFFPDIQARARELSLSPELCLALLSGDTASFESVQNRQYREFGIAAKLAAGRFLDGPQFRDWERPFDAWIEQISVGGFNNKQIPSFSSTPSITTPPESWFFFDDTARRGILEDLSEDSCGAGGDLNCKAIVDDLGNAINDYNLSYRVHTLNSTGRTLDKLSGQWDRYLESARAQTILDLALTSYLERKHFRAGYLVGPPPRQWSLLRPNLVVEHAGDAPQGEKDKLTVAVEWIGVNWWDERSPLFDIPFGISLASIYADRPDIDSGGHGVMLHIDNKYSLGWATRSGDSSFFFSVDLLKFVENKEAQFNRYKAEILESIKGSE